MHGRGRIRSDLTSSNGNAPKRELVWSCESSGKPSPAPNRQVGQKGLFRTMLPAIAASAGYAHGGVTGGLESLLPTAVAAGYTTPLVQKARANLKGALGRALAWGNVSNDTRLLQRGLASNAYDQGQLRQ